MLIGRSRFGCRLRESFGITKEPIRRSLRSEGEPSAASNDRRRDRSDLAIGIVGGSVFFIVVELWALNWRYLAHDDKRGSFGDMFGAVNALFSGLAFAGIIIAILLQRQEMKESRMEFAASAEEQRKFYQAERLAKTKVTSDAIFREWWGLEMSALRRYFYFEFLPKHYARIAGGNLKELEHKVPGDEGQLRKLTDFFDRVGWLGAAGLVDVDYVLGPMQHTMRRVWLATEPLITCARKRNPPGQLDPVYRLGFEWLFRRSEDKTHATLLAQQFSDPALFSTDGTFEELNTHIQRDEQEFRQRLIALRRQSQSELPRDASALIKKDPLAGGF